MEDIKKWREIKLTLVSADSLPDVRNFGRMKVYASVGVMGLSSESCCFLHSPTDTVLSFGSKNMEDAKSNFLHTPTDTEGETNPKWNFPMKLVVSESELRETKDICLLVFLLCQRSFGSHKYVGLAIVPLKDLIEQGPNHASTLHQVLGDDLDPNGGTVTISVDDITESCSEPRKLPAKPAHSNVDGLKVLEIVLKLVQAATDVIPKIITGMQ